MANSFENIEAAVKSAIDPRFPAEGVLLTDWGDDGHMQPPAVGPCPLTRSSIRECLFMEYPVHNIGCDRLETAELRRKS